MKRYTHKMCRRLGIKLCQSAKCPLVRRNYPPGIHGPKGRPRQTEYGMQLAEKQKAKVVYNMLERQFRLVFERAVKLPGDTGHNLLTLLETRFDNTVYRSGFAGTRVQAKQLVSHGHFLVNGKKINIPSYQLKVGDVISLHGASLNNKYFKQQLGKIKQEKIPGWLYLDMPKKEIKVLGAPKDSDAENVFDTKAIIEYYSRR
ncbi:30S ribosomal protein S4 [Candidatus Falkowbacteria bacterium CG10_big_fil_rev_8_21_14_0_10_43_11]|uniref:Small ribosomal subunit protein uS4 n=1 Tax=Candidatus Falkowbacteria bacterium CG10_big_fil_rev_8_21_14_0_10_43_11 TaxID=1974568 RepID=A0A2M6WMC9_9BACT|nr:MAG: 30S ribosomal protein S4 [Candidatus Falkowbacteria bacterium CG10_big_fil_rev_8_21_14_0_10_43_11]